MLLLLLACDPCSPDEVSLDQGPDWDDLMLPQGVSACEPAVSLYRKSLFRGRGTPEELLGGISTSLQRAGWKPLEDPHEFARGDKKAIVEVLAHTESVAEARLRQVDYFDVYARFADWDAAMVRAREVEAGLRSVELETEAPGTCPEATKPTGRVDLRALNGEPGTWSSNAFRVQVGLPPITEGQLNDLGYHQARYAYAEALAEGPIALVGVVETVAPRVGEGGAFDSGLSRGGVWVVRDGAVICQGSFVAMNTPEVEFGRGTPAQALDANLESSAYEAMLQTCTDLVGTELR